MVSWRLRNYPPSHPLPQPKKNKALGKFIFSGNLKSRKKKLNTELRKSHTSYQTGHDEGQDEHLEHAHEDVSRELYEHDDFLAGVGCARSEPDDPTEDDSEHRQHQKQVVLAPPGKLQYQNIILKSQNMKVKCPTAGRYQK